MKTLKFDEKEIKRIENLINDFETLYEIENWSIEDLNAFREIGTEIIKILKEKIKLSKNA